MKNQKSNLKKFADSNLVFVFGAALALSTSCGKTGSAISGLGAGDGNTDNVSLSDDIAENDYRIFVTSGTYSADLQAEGSAATAHEGADNLCAAAASGLDRTYKALVSSASEDASSRLDFSNGGSVKKVDSSGNAIQVAASGAALFDTASNDLDSVVDLDENGDSVTGTAWTNTDASGSAVGMCGNLSISTGFASRWGVIGNLDADWLNFDAGVGGPCSTKRRVICVSQ